MNFTQEQQLIFDFIKQGTGNGIIDAVAGSGKTTTIMECTKYVPAQKSTLFCAFNKSIAQEIRGKLAQMNGQNVTVKTIHALGWQLLSENMSQINVKESKYAILLYSDAMRRKLDPIYWSIFLILKENKWLKTFQPRENADEIRKAYQSTRFEIDKTIKEMIDKVRVTLTQSMEDFTEMVVTYNLIAKEQATAEHVKLYKNAIDLLLKEGNKMAEEALICDYTDMLYLPYLWKLKPRKVFDFLFIDECQDLSKAQLDLVLKFACSEARLVAVGDPNQAIYGFAGADAQSFSRIVDTLKGRQFPLTTCFRCPEKVIELAKKLRADITGKAGNPVGTVKKIKYNEVEKQLVKGDLIISRYRGPLIILMFHLLDETRLISVNEDDANQLIYELKRIFKQTEMTVETSLKNRESERFWGPIEKRNKYRLKMEIEKQRKLTAATKKLKIEEAHDELMETIAYIQRLWAKSPQSATIDQLLKDVHMRVTRDDPTAIKLSTIHRAKGLENERVFILDYNSLPATNADMQPWEKEQERNLKYVALTRPKQQLFLVETDGGKKQESRGKLFSYTM